MNTSKTNLIVKISDSREEQYVVNIRGSGGVRHEAMVS